MKEYLYTMLRSLNSITVKGKDNMETLLGCIMATEQMISAIESQEDVSESCEEETQAEEE